MGFTEQLSILIDAKTGGAIRDIERLSQATKSATDQQQKMGGVSGFVQQKLNAMGLSGVQAGSLIGAGVGTVGVAAVGALAHATQEGITKQLQLADAVRSVVGVTGMSAENASRLVEVTGDYGIEIGTVEKAMFRLANQTQNNANVFKEHNIQIAQNKDGTTDLLGTLENVQKQYIKTGDATERDKILMDLFGKAGKDLIPIMRENVNLKKALADVPLSRILDEQDLAQARQYQLAMDDLHDAVNAIQRELGAAVIPAITDYAIVVGTAIEKTLALKDAAFGLFDHLGKFGTIALHAITDSFIKMIPVVGPTVGLIKDLGGVFGLGSHHADRFADAQKRVADAEQHVKDLLNEGKQNTPEYTQAQKELTAAKDANAAKTRELSDAMQTENEKMQTGIDLANQRLNAQAGLVGATLNYQESLNKHSAAQDKVNQLEAEGKTDTLEYTAAKIELTRADVNVVQTHGQVVSAALALKKQYQDGTISAKEYKAQLDAWKATNPELAASIDAVTWSANAVPKDVTTTAHANTQEAFAAWSSYRALLLSIPGIITTQANTISSSGFFRASGGPVEANRMYVVGEEGPELFMPNASGTIIPNGGTGSLLTPPASPTAYAHSAALGKLTIPVVLDGRVVTEVVVSNLNRAGGPKISQKAVV